MQSSEWKSFSCLVLVFCITFFFPLMNGWLQSLCHTPEIFVWLFKRKKKNKPCVTSHLFLYSYLLAGSQSDLAFLLPHDVHKH